MNWPNRISLFRLILVPIIFILLIIYRFPGAFAFAGWQGVISSNVMDGHVYHLPIAWLIAGVLFCLASLSDMLDGYIARKYNQVTTFGKFFDAIADKLLTNSVLIAFACAGIIPVWMCCVLILRDFLIDVVRQVLASQKVIMAANNWGKYKAACEMFGLLLLFFVSFQHFGGAVHGTSVFGEFGWVNQVILIPMYVATILSVASAGNYMYLNRKALFDMTNKHNG